MIRLALQAPPQKPLMNHQAFNCRDMQELDYWYEQLSEYDVAMSKATGHQSMGSISLYFNDPWANSLETGCDVGTWETAQQLVQERGGGFIGLDYRGGSQRPQRKAPTIAEIEAQRRGTPPPA